MMAGVTLTLISAIIFLYCTLQYIYGSETSILTSIRPLQKVMITIAMTYLIESTYAGFFASEYSFLSMMEFTSKHMFNNLIVLVWDLLTIIPYIWQLRNTRHIQFEKSNEDSLLEVEE